MSPARHALPVVPFLLVVLLPAWVAQAEPLPIAQWRKTVDGLFEDLRSTVRRRDQLAFEKELAALIEQGAEPQAEFRGELGARLAVAPPGVALNALVLKLVADGSDAAVHFIFDALSTPVFQDLAGRELGEKEAESRRRIIECYLMRLGDRAWAARQAEKPPARPVLQLSPELEARLQREVGSDDARRVRCSAYMLGGAGTPGALAGLVQSVDRLEKYPQTKSMVIEAIGRIDPLSGASVLEGAAGAKSEQVRLAALPPLGKVESQAAGKLIKDASESPRWAVRRAAFEACRQRRDLAAMDILMERYPKESARLQFDILQVALDISGGAMPPDPKEWTRWWKTARAGFKPARKGAAGEADSSRGKTVVVGSTPQYFGMEIWSSQLAMVCDISGSMLSSNVNLGSSGVAVAGALKEGSPIAVAKDQIQRLLKAFSPKTQFNIIAYNQAVKPFHEKLLPATRQNVASATKFVGELKADGGTNIHDSLILALKDQEVDTIYLLSDGEPTDGQRLHPDDILEAVLMVNRFRKTRINTIQIGEHQELMRELAELSGGKYQLLGVPDEPAKKEGKAGGKKK